VVLNLKLLDYRISDNFPLLHRRFQFEGELDHALSPAETASLGEVVRFPAAPNGNSPELKRFWKY
jgi:hypothetical protein